MDPRATQCNRDPDTGASTASPRRRDDTNANMKRYMSTDQVRDGPGTCARMPERQPRAQSRRKGVPVKTACVQTRWGKLNWAPIRNGRTQHGAQAVRGCRHTRRYQPGNTNGTLFAEIEWETLQATAERMCK
jgi:hypothetical protein